MGRGPAAGGDCLLIGITRLTQVNMDINQARRNQITGQIIYYRVIIGTEVGPDRGNLAVLNQNVTGCQVSIDHATTVFQ